MGVVSSLAKMENEVCNLLLSLFTLEEVALYWQEDWAGMRGDSDLLKATETSFSKEADVVVEYDIALGNDIRMELDPKVFIP